MKWITRERPNSLIKNFVDKEAVFLYIRFTEVLGKTKTLNANKLAKIHHFAEKNCLKSKSFTKGKLRSIS